MEDEQGSEEDPGDIYEQQLSDLNQQYSSYRKRQGQAEGLDDLELS